MSKQIQHAIQLPRTEFSVAAYKERSQRRHLLFRNAGRAAFRKAQSIFHLNYTVRVSQGMLKKGNPAQSLSSPGTAHCNQICKVQVRGNKLTGIERCGRESSNRGNNGCQKKSASETVHRLWRRANDPSMRERKASYYLRHLVRQLIASQS